MAANTVERGRITARLSANAQQLIETAAQIAATTTNQFVAQAALREAERIVANEFFVALPRRDIESFFEALDNTSLVNPRLSAAIATYKEMKSDGSGSSSSTFKWKSRSKQV